MAVEMEYRTIFLLIALLAMYMAFTNAGRDFLKKYVGINIIKRG